MLAGGSKDAGSEVGGVSRASEASLTGTGGGNPTISVSAGIVVAAIGGSTGASWLGTVWGALTGAGGGGGLLKMLAQLRVPSGFEGGFGGSAAGA